METLMIVACVAAGLSVYFGYFGVLYGLALLVMMVLSCLIGSLPRKSCDLNQMLSYMCIPLAISSVLATSPECSQSLSAVARSVINRSVHPVYHLFHAEMPSNCPLHPDNDQYHNLEKLKHHLGDSGKLVCSVCGKVFDNDDDIDTHIRHSHETAVGYAQGCLADYCDVLRCGVNTRDVNAENFQCDRTYMAEIHDKCMTLVQDQCTFSQMEPGEKLKLETAVQASICNFLTCETYFLIVEDKLEDVYSRYYFTYVVLFMILVVFIGIYFRVATKSMDKSLTWEEFIKAEKESIAREPIGRMPPASPEMTIRQRQRESTRRSETQ